MNRARLMPLLAAGYLLLLLGSHAVRRWATPPESTTPAAELVEIATPGAEPGTRPVRLAYRSWELSSDAGHGVAAPVVLLHGSPGSSLDFRTLGPLLAAHRGVLAPDLPGFGQSQRDVPNYSIAAHAEYVAALLAKLGIDTAHVVGFSMGGGVALELADREPGKVLSVTLLSAIGVQELELLGSYELNHAIHAMQLGGLWLLHEAVPHFGLLDGFPLDVQYARNFFDTDQRPLRGILERIEIPVLIVHGDDDFLVPAAAAREHHRLVPQSELAMLRGSHFMVFRADERLALPIASFLERVDEGDALRRRDAAEARLMAARGPFDPSSIPAAAGVTLAVLLCLIALATLVSEDATCIATGLLVAQGRIGFLAGTAACAAGILVGDALIYAAGRFLGRPWLHRRPLCWVIKPRALARGSEWFARRGPAVVLLSRFLPGTRVAAYFSAGLLRASFWKFLFFFVVAVSVWTPLLVGLSAWLGSRLAETFGTFERFALPGAVGFAVAAALLVNLIRSLSSWRGRRLLLGAIRRKREWEFWPWWAIYLPVYPWIAWLGVRHRSLTLFTAANPGIECGGFVGESKAAILAALDPRCVARFEKIPAAEPAERRLARAREFVEREGLPYPVVAKPDVGERGAGFTVVRGRSELEALIASMTRSVLLQEFVGGVELGIFYVRRPDEPTGRIFSITDKRLLSLQGDGISTLEELILRDERAMRQAPIHLDRMASRLGEVPPAGAEIPLVNLGVHSRGALFLDGARFKTPELETAVDEISRSFDGFFFGRYDLRAPSHEAFRRGEDLTVLELNGVTSEATHIYDPGNSYAKAVGVLCRQWRLAFEIGAENRSRGERPAPLGELLGLAFRHLSGRARMIASADR